MIARHAALGLCALGLAYSVTVVAQPAAAPAPAPSVSQRPAMPPPTTAPVPPSATVPVPNPEGLASFTDFQPGMWELKSDGGVARSLCISDPETLVQLHHAGVACSRMVIANTKTDAIVHYSCPGAGWGRTAFKVDGPRHMRISTQGIADRAPFDDVTEARRTGDCGGVAWVAHR